VKNIKLFLIVTSIIAVMAFAIWYEFSYKMRNPPESGPVTLPKIDRQPQAFDFNRGGMTALPTYDPNSTDPWQMDLDLRSYDLSALDLSRSISDLLYATFDDGTAWPPDDRMPEGFDPHHIMDLGKDPGLGIRSLHAQGITGRGVGIAIIDQTLMVDHQEYAGQLRLYEEISAYSDAELHGAAVASIAVGKTVGVAPEADLYYIATSFGGNDYTNLARCIQRIVEVNDQLPQANKIRVISISAGWGEDVTGYEELEAAVGEAKNASMLIVCSSIVRIYGFKFQGLGRSPLADPDAIESYEPGMFWARDFYAGEVRPSDRLLVPMDSRTTASPTGQSDYVFYREGGWSWSIPYIAGLYALAAQVDPEITPERFWSLAMETGRTIELKHDGETIPLGPIVDPVALIERIQADLSTQE